MARSGSLLGGGGGGPLDLYGDLFTDEQKQALQQRELSQGLLGFAAKLGAASAPSREPKSGFLGLLGQAAGGFASQGDEQALKGMEIAEKVRESRRKRAALTSYQAMIEKALVAAGIDPKSPQGQQAIAAGAGAATAPVAPGAPQGGPLASNAPPPPPGPQPSTGIGAPEGMPLGGAAGAEWLPNLPVPPSPPPPGPQAGLLPPPPPGANPQMGANPGMGGGLLAGLPFSMAAGQTPGPSTSAQEAGPNLAQLASLMREDAGGGGDDIEMPFPTRQDPNKPKSAWEQGYTYEQPKVPYGQAPEDRVRPGGGGRQATVEFWKSRGAPQHVAEGIADRVNAESGFNPAALNPNDKGAPSGGLYQHRADRLTRLQSFAAAQGKPWTDPAVQHEFAATEVGGGDSQATRGFPAIMAAPDRQTAAKLWDRHFERSAAGPGRSLPDVGRVRVEPLGGEAAPAGQGGVIPGINMTPTQLGLLNALGELGGLDSPFKSLLESYYKSPGYLGEIKRQSEQIETDFAGKKAGAQAEATQKYILEQQEKKSAQELARDLIGKGVYLNKETKRMEPIENAAQAFAAIQNAQQTPDIKEYNFYAQQEAERGGIPKPFSVWDVERRKASATSINTAEGFGAAQTKARVGVDAKIAQDVAEQAITGRRLMPVLDELAYLADKTPEGWRGTLAPTVGRTLATIGVPVPQGASNAEAFQALAQRLVPIVREPGATSQGEMSLYLQAGPALSGTANGRKQIIEINRAMIQRSQEIAKVYRENIGAPDLYEKLGALDKPLFTDEQRAAMQAVTGQVPATTTVPPPPSGTPAGAPRELRWNPATGRAE